MLPSSALAALATRIDALLLPELNLAWARELAETCLVDDEPSYIRFPAHPEEPFPDDDIPLSLGQRALAMAALHDLVCTGVEKVVPIDSNLSHVDPGGTTRNDLPRDLRWICILELLQGRLQTAAQVQAFQAEVERWFTRQFHHFERDLARAAACASLGGVDPDPPPNLRVQTSRAESPASTPSQNASGGLVEGGCEFASQYVTLDQMAATVNRSKSALERRLNAVGSTMPRPDVEGGGGSLTNGDGTEFVRG